jgi:hypothetical protein
MARNVEVDIDPSTLARALQAGRVPTKAVVLAFVDACGGDAELWQRQYTRLRTALRTGKSVEFVPWPDAQGCEAYLMEPTSTQLGPAFAAEMRFLWMHSGMTLREVAEQTRNPAIAEASGVRGLSVSTISDLCNTNLVRSLPHRSTVRAFLHAVGATPREVDAWLAIHGVISSRQSGGAEQLLIWAHALKLLNAPREQRPSAGGYLVHQCVVCGNMARRRQGEEITCLNCGQNTTYRPWGRTSIPADPSPTSKALRRLVLYRFQAAAATHLGLVSRSSGDSNDDFIQRLGLAIRSRPDLLIAGTLAAVKA